jgi:hypothetical protein
VTRFRTFHMRDICLAVSLFLFLGCLYGSESITAPNAVPDGIATNIPTLVTFTATLPANSALIPISVNLVQYNAQGQAVAILGQLYDDGTHGDQTAADNVFTTQLTITQRSTTQLFYRVSAAYRGSLTRALSPQITIDVIQLPTPQQQQAVISTTQQAGTLFSSLSATATPTAAMSAVVTWLLQQTNVEAAAATSDGASIGIRYTNGLNAILSTGAVGTLGGPPSNTGGIIGSPVAYVSPFAEPELQSVYTKWLGTGLIQVRPPTTEPNFSVAFLKTLSQYGYISLATHGALTLIGDPVLMTSDSAATDTSLLSQIDWLRGYLTLGILVSTTTPPTPNTNWWVTPAFFSHYDKMFPGSVVFLTACDSLNNNNLASAFIQNGAQAVFGWQGSVFAEFAKDTKDALMADLLDNHVTVGRAYNDVSQVDSTPCTGSGCPSSPAVLRLAGAADATLVSPLTPTSVTYTLSGKYTDVTQATVSLQYTSSGFITQQTTEFSNSLDFCTTTASADTCFDIVFYPAFTSWPYETVITVYFRNSIGYVEAFYNFPTGTLSDTGTFVSLDGSASLTVTSH